MLRLRIANPNALRLFLLYMKVFKGLPSFKEKEISPNPTEKRGAREKLESHPSGK